LLKVPRAVALICVETQSADEVVAAEARLAAADLETTGVDDTQCCYAQKTATWPSGPDGARWEWYVKTGDSEQLANLVVNPTGGGCCPA
jgi:hypothetical protein